MRFDEAFDVLVEHCAARSRQLAAATGRTVSIARGQTYGNDIWIPAIVQTHYQRNGIDPNTLTEEQYLPFYDAAWELCRIGVLRPGPPAPQGMVGIGGGGTFSNDGYSNSVRTR